VKYANIQDRENFTIYSILPVMGKNFTFVKCNSFFRKEAGAELQNDLPTTVTRTATTLTLKILIASLKNKMYKVSV
jgi:hypothetical protein